MQKLLLFTRAKKSVQWSMKYECDVLCWKMYENTTGLVIPKESFRFEVQTTLSQSTDKKSKKMLTA
ncbi:MAG: hypothetical protein ACE5I1_02900 [bacterium]